MYAEIEFSQRSEQMVSLVLLHKYLFLVAVNQIEGLIVVFYKSSI